LSAARAATTYTSQGGLTLFHSLFRAAALLPDAVAEYKHAVAKAEGA
jgi:hypothetical protein